MRTATLLPDADALHLETLVADGDAITVVVTTRSATARCPDCGAASAHLHSRKRRRIADLPWQGLAASLDRQLRRFYCRTPTCARRTFTERVPAVVAPSVRRTARLAAVIEAVAFALGGEPGARLLAALGLATSPDTLLRAIAAEVLARDFLALLRGRDQGGARRLAGPGRRRRRAGVPRTRRRAGPGPPRRGRDPQPGMEQRAGRGARQQAEAGEARDVRARGLSAPPAARARRGVRRRQPPTSSAVRHGPAPRLAARRRGAGEYSRGRAGSTDFTGEPCTLTLDTRVYRR